jgi:methionine-gamma-lyase
MKLTLSAVALAALTTTYTSAFQVNSNLPRRAVAFSKVGVAKDPEVTVTTNASDDEQTVNSSKPVVPVVRKEDEEVHAKHARPKSFATKCASLYHPKKGAARGLSPPVYFGSTFLLDDANHGARLHEKREAPYTDEDGFVYSRWGSPTNEAAALQIAALEGVDDLDPITGQSRGECLLFNSGMSAITSALMSVLRAGDHAIFPFTVYGGTHEFAESFCKEWGIEVSYVDAAGENGPANYRAAFQENTKVVYAETPANPTMRLTDLKGVAQVIQDHYGPAIDTPGTHPHDRKRPWLMCDGTFATPYHTRALDMGVDVSIHSATKYLGGHSDILAGAVTSCSEPFLHGCAKVQKLITVPLNPMDSFLLARGLRTLDVRMQRHGENALKIAQMLETHPSVAKTIYPGLDSHPDRAMATAFFGSGRDADSEDDEFKQTYGGMVTWIMAGDENDDNVALKRAQNVCEHLRVINLAVSLGGVESLIEHPASMTHTMIPRETRKAGGLDDGLIRLSVGLERAKDLLEDLKSALDRCDFDPEDEMDEFKP